MLRFCLTVPLLLATGLLADSVAAEQIPVTDWAERPDARSPAGLVDDALPRAREVEFLYNLRTTQHENLLAGTDEIPPILVLSGTDLNWLPFGAAPVSASSQRHEVEMRLGLLEWLGASIRVPWVSTSTDFVTNQLSGSPSASGIGDVELHLLYGVHDVWPYRAHLGAGFALPTGATDASGSLPDQPGEARVLPYPMQPGNGTATFLPAAVLVAENEFGTVGLRANARVSLGENDRGWSRGTMLEGNLWMAYRFTDWVSGSVRLAVTTIGELSGSDPAMDPWSTPPANPALQGGTRVELPIGINLLFAEGPLRGNRLRAEFILPVHQDLNGPQLRSRYGAALSWGVTFF